MDTDTKYAEEQMNEAELPTPANEVVVPGERLENKCYFRIYVLIYVFYDNLGD